MQVPKPVRMGFEGKAAQVEAVLGDDLWELHGAGMKVLEFARGRAEAEFRANEVLRAAVTMLLNVMAVAAERISAASEEMSGRLSGMTRLREVAEADDLAELWSFVSSELPDLVASAAGQLARWHDGSEMGREPEEQVWDYNRE